MYIEGVISEVDETGTKARLTVEELDDFKTPYLSVSQIWAVGNKSRLKALKGTLVGAILSDDMDRGMIIGAIYNDEDIIPQDKNNDDFIQFQDGVFISHEDGSNTLKLKADKVIIDCTTLESTGDVKDKKGTMQDIRDWNNSHCHTNGNNGSDTGTPTSKI